MSARHRKPPESASIRQLAERRLAGGAAVALEGLTPDEIRGFVHELEVHRVELEIQNRQLAEAQLAAEESKERYRQLYETAPIGYVTLDPDGLVVAANQCASLLLGLPRARLLGRKLTAFVAEGHQDRWHLARRALEESSELRSFELSLSRSDGTPVDTQILGSGGPEAQGNLSLALLDVTELRGAERALRRAASEASLAEQRERRKLASDLHDDAGQLLSLASLKLRAHADALAGEHADALRELAQILTEARQRIASLSFQLSPPLLHDVGLVAAARWLAEDLGRRYGLAVHVAADEELALDEATRITLFRAIRELLINVTRHAGVGEARLELWSEGGLARAAVEDAGVGFATEPGRGFGLLALRERLGQLGGTLEIAAGRAGVGSRVVASVPVTSRAVPGEGGPA